MYTPKFELLSFASLPVQRKQIVLRAALEFLIVADWNFILDHGGLPSLYDFAPQYVLKVRPAGLDSWQDIPQTISLGSGDCIAEETPIATSRGELPIEEVRPGDLVQTRGGIRRVERAGLVGVASPTVIVTTSSGASVRATPDHRIFTLTRDWVSARELREGDEVLARAKDGSRSPARVLRVEDAAPARVYDLSVEGWPEFFAGGVLVHNCKDFACWRIAELRNQGYDDVYPHIKVSYHEDPRGIEPMMTVYHIQVRIHDQIEDPSALLGMPTQVSYDQLRG